MSTHGTEREVTTSPASHGADARIVGAHSDRRLSYAIVAMFAMLGVLFGLIVPAAILLLHRASGY
jgi:hypothetical protein